MRKVCYQISLLVLSGWVVSFLPSPTEAVPLRLKNGIVGVIVVLGIGKILYDSLFYDRYQP
jgi:hypothetical protein